MQKLAFAVLSLGLSGSLGCNQIADINDPRPKDGPTGTGTTPAGASGTAPPGTGTSETAPPGGGDTSKFVGKWSGTVTVTYANCTNTPPQPAPTSTLLTISASAKGLRLVDSDGCAVELTVNGDAASAIAGSECSGTTSEGVDLSSTLSSGSFTLTSNTSATLRASGKATASDGVVEASCDFTQSGQFTKGDGS